MHAITEQNEKYIIEEPNDACYNEWDNEAKNHLNTDLGKNHKHGVG